MDITKLVDGTTVMRTFAPCAIVFVTRVLCVGLLCGLLSCGGGADEVDRGPIIGTAPAMDLARQWQGTWASNQASAVSPPRQGTVAVTFAQTPEDRSLLTGEWAMLGETCATQGHFVGTFLKSRVMGTVRAGGGVTVLVQANVVANGLTLDGEYSVQAAPPCPTDAGHFVLEAVVPQGGL